MVVLAIFACIFLAIVMMKIVKAMMSMIDHLDDVAEEIWTAGSATA